MLKPLPPSDTVIIYTDGGAVPNPGVGGWGAILLCKGKMRELSGGEPQTTNNRMELTAACVALETLKRPCAVELHTDSQYVRNGITEWMRKWKRNGWKASGKPVKNRDLWERLDAAAERHVIRWKWVRGHAGDFYNERCDELAGEEIRRRMGG